jgi:hypothetical protein
MHSASSLPVFHAASLPLQVLVNRMRVRFRLNEQRVAEMLRGIDPDTLGSNFVTVTAGLLGCIGDIASLKFMPIFEGAPRVSAQMQTPSV